MWMQVVCGVLECGGRTVSGCALCRTWLGSRLYSGEWIQWGAFQGMGRMILSELRPVEKSGSGWEKCESDFSFSQCSPVSSKS